MTSAKHDYPSRRVVPHSYAYGNSYLTPYTPILLLRVYQLRFCMSTAKLLYCTGIGQGRVTDNVQGAPIDYAVHVRDRDAVAMVSQIMVLCS